MCIPPFLTLCLWLAGSTGDSPLALPLDGRPQWLQRDGIVMVGSWEPLLFRVRRDGSEGYTPTPEQRAAYEREHSPEMVAEFKRLGANFVMMHAYKGFGLRAERESMEDAVRFAKQCRQAGLRVGVYAGSGTLGWELFYQEQPQAKDWILLNGHGNPIPYGSAAYRYYFNRNHPALLNYQREVIRFSVEKIQADLLHFDNYCVGPGTDAQSVSSFREYLSRTFSPQQLAQAGIDDVDTVTPPIRTDAQGPLRLWWLDFSCQWLADSYRELSRYARSLRSDILLECNPGGPSSRITPPIDHGRLLSAGEAFWDESVASGYRDRQLQSRIRTYKVARLMNNMAFSYTTTPLEAAESMAFNLNCLGCVGWFEYGKFVALPGSTRPVSSALKPYIQFFNTRRDLFRDTEVLADVAIWRNFASQVFAPASLSKVGRDPPYCLTANVEQRLIEQRIPFQIIFDPQLHEVNRYRALVLAGCVALSDEQVSRVRDYVRGGGHLCIIGAAATHDQWMKPRTTNPLADLGRRRPLTADQVLRAEESDDWIEAIRRACGSRLTVSIDAEPGVCMEVIAQRNRRLIHLVNYRSDEAANNVAVRLSVPPGTRVRNVVLTSPERPADMEIKFTSQADTAIFTVPAVRVYEIAVVNLDDEVPAPR